ncbi:hypothetical protein J3E68DRAFT_51922 [Trichoderma sp. SZMC 28012]
MKIEIASKARNRARNTLRALRTRTWAALRYLVPRAGAGTPYSVQESGDGRRNQKPNGRVSIWFASTGPLVSTNKRSARGAQHRWLVRAGVSARVHCRAKSRAEPWRARARARASNRHQLACPSSGFHRRWGPSPSGLSIYFPVAVARARRWGVAKSDWAIGPLTRVDHQVEWRGRKGGCWRHAKEQLEGHKEVPGGVWREGPQRLGCWALYAKKGQLWLYSVNILD